MARRRGVVPVRCRSDRAFRGREPIRTCVGCRTTGPATGLLRVVAVEGILVPDPQRRRPGRGAWLHPDLDCLHTAERRRAFPRAFRVQGPLDSSAVRAHLEQLAQTAGSAIRARRQPKLMEAGRPVMNQP